jgi:hypothetical protein
MLDGILRLLGGASHKAKCRNLENGFAVAADDYWAEHSDFGLGGVRSPTLVGQGRAREVVVNVVLPFFFAWADAHSQHLKKEILELYEIYPRLSQNWVTYRMSEQLAGEKASSIVNSAQRQQGLLHLYNAFCVGRKCGECPLGRAFDWRISVSAV